MKRLDLLEFNHREVSHSIENNDFTLLPFVDSVSTFAYLRKLENSTCLLITNELKEISSHFDGVYYQKSIYDPRFNAQGTVCLSYDIVLFLLTQDRQFFQKYDFVVLDDIDRRSVNTDLLLGILGHFTITSTFIIPLSSNFGVLTYELYLKSFGLKVNTLNLVTRPSIKTYTVNAQPKLELLNQTILETVNQILKTDSTTEAYDILIILHSAARVKEFNFYLSESTSSKPYSIITNISEYQIRGSNRRLVIHTGSQDFQKINHRIKYIIDSGLVSVELHDTNLLPMIITKQTNNNLIQAHISILDQENSTYFGLYPSKQSHDYEYGILNANLLPQVLLILKLGMQLKDLRLLRPPTQEQLERCISYLVFLGYVTVVGSVVKLTELGERLMNFQFEFDLAHMNTIALLIHSPEYRCTKEMLKLVSMLVALDWNALSIYFKELKVQSILNRDNDFISIINIYDSIIVNETLRPHHLTMTFNEFFGKVTKKRILDIFKVLRERLNSPVNYEDANESSINKALFKSFQLHSGLLRKTISNNSITMTLSVKPVYEFTTSTYQNPSKPIEFLWKQTNLSLKEEENYANNDIIVFSKCEYHCIKNILFNPGFSILTVPPLVSDDIMSRDRDQIFINFGARIPRRSVRDVGSMLFKFR